MSANVWQANNQHTMIAARLWACFLVLLVLLLFFNMSAAAADLDFGCVPVNVSTLKNAKGIDIYCIPYDGDGKELWGGPTVRRLPWTLLGATMDVFLAASTTSIKPTPQRPRNTSAACELFPWGGRSKRPNWATAASGGT